MRLQGLVQELDARDRALRTMREQAARMEGTIRKLVSAAEDQKARFSSAQRRMQAATKELAELRAQLTASQHRTALLEREKAGLAEQLSMARRSADEAGGTLAGEREEMAAEARELMVRACLCIEGSCGVSKWGRWVRLRW